MLMGIGNGVKCPNAHEDLDAGPLRINIMGDQVMTDRAAEAQKSSKPDTSINRVIHATATSSCGYSGKTSRFQRGTGSKDYSPGTNSALVSAFDRR